MPAAHHVAFVRTRRGAPLVCVGRVLPPVRCSGHRPLNRVHARYRRAPLVTFAAASMTLCYSRCRPSACGVPWSVIVVASPRYEREIHHRSRKPPELDEKQAGGQPRGRPDTPPDCPRMLNRRPANALARPIPARPIPGPAGTPRPCSSPARPGSADVAAWLLPVLSPVLAKPSARAAFRRRVVLFLTDAFLAEARPGSADVSAWLLPVLTPRLRQTPQHRPVGLGVVLGPARWPGSRWSAAGWPPDRPAGPKPRPAGVRGPAFARGVAGNTALLAWVLWGERSPVGERFTRATHCTRGVARRTGYHAEGRGSVTCLSPTAL
jgi:hypothetical protein